MFWEGTASLLLQEILQSVRKVERVGETKCLLIPNILDTRVGSHHYCLGIWFPATGTPRHFLCSSVQGRGYDRSIAESSHRFERTHSTIIICISPGNGRQFQNGSQPLLPVPGACSEIDSFLLKHLRAWIDTSQAITKLEYRFFCHRQSKLGPRPSAFFFLSLLFPPFSS